MLAASSRVTVVTFEPFESSNVFGTTRETAAKFSTVRLPLKRRVSRVPLHSAHSRSRKLDVWVAHKVDIVGERHTNSCLRSQETLHFLLGTLMSVGKETG